MRSQPFTEIDKESAAFPACSALLFVIGLSGWLVKWLPFGLVRHMLLGMRVLLILPLLLTVRAIAHHALHAAVRDPLPFPRKSILRSRVRSPLSLPRCYHSLAGFLFPLFHLYWRQDWASFPWRS
jgi:hypothetical protein